MSAAELPPLTVDPEFCVLSRRNNSLDTRQRWTLFAGLAAVSLGLALAFVAAGAWPVLPYSVLEISVLGLAFAWIERRSGDWERLTIAGDRVIVEQETGGTQSRREFNRWWLRVELEEAGFMRPAQLTLRCAGDEIAFGGALPPRERTAVAQELTRLLRAR